MDRIALFGALFFSLFLATSGSMSSATVAARKGYNPRLGALFGWILGFVGGFVPAYIWLLADQQGSYAVLISIAGSLAVLIALWQLTPDRDPGGEDLPLGESLRLNILGRHTRGVIMRFLFIASIAVALVMLAILLGTIINKSIGLVAVQYTVPPEALAVSAYDTGYPLGEVPDDEIPTILAENVRQVRLQQLVLDRIAGGDIEDWPTVKFQPVGALLAETDAAFDDALAATPIGDLTRPQATDILVGNLPEEDLQILVYNEAGRTLSEHSDAQSVLSDAEVIEVLADSISAEQLQALILTEVMGIPAEEAEPTNATLWQTVKVVDYSSDLALKPFSMLSPHESAGILVNNIDAEALKDLIKQEVGSDLIREELPLVRVERPIEGLSAEELANVLARNVPADRMQTLVLDMARVSEEERIGVEEQPLGEVLAGESYPEILTLMHFGQLDSNQAADILMQNMDQQELVDLVTDEVGPGLYEVGRPLQDLPDEEINSILATEVRPARLRVLLLQQANVPEDQWSTASQMTVGEVLPEFEVPEETAGTTFGELSATDAANILTRHLDSAALQALVKAEARDRLLAELPETILATVLAENVSITRLHSLIVSEVLLADNPDWPTLVLEPVLSAEQASDILMRNLDRETLEALVFKETGTALIEKRDEEGLTAALANNVRRDRLQELLLTEVVEADPDDRSFSGDITWQVLKGEAYPTELGEQPFNTLTAHQAADILVRNLPRQKAEEIYILEGDHRSLEDVSPNALGAVMSMNVRKARLRVILLARLAGIGPSDLEKMSAEQKQALGARPLRELLEGKNVPPDLAEKTYAQLSEPQIADLMVRNLGRGDVEEVLFDNVVQEQVAEGWDLWTSWTDRAGIDEFQRTELPRADIKWRSWVNQDFLNNTISYTQPDETGIRSGLRGTLLVILITIVFAFPIGVGAAIYLEEYAADVSFRSPWLDGIAKFMNRIIQTNISNLAGVPSIIYGILGLAIFVRALEALTSGSLFGGLGVEESANGRTVLSAGFTLALLILPLIIINAQEAIRAVPDSLRQASYGLGATKWQTIWNHVLPYAMPGVLTGTILAISRAIGETAPLILVGGATFLLKDPEGPFSQFTALPLLIYRWTTLPQSEFRNAAAAAIIVLLILLLTLNSVAVFLRNRFTRRLS